MADSDKDPVTELLLSLKSRKSSKKIDSRKIDEAINYHNQIVTELGGQRPAEEDASKPPTVFEKIQQENIILKRELVETRNRLNKVTRDKRESNGTTTPTTPTVQNAEMNDPFRPPVLAEEFRTMYDNEWKSAYNELDKLKKNEGLVVDIIVTIIKGADQLCSLAMGQHLARIEQVAMEDLKLMRVQLPGNMQDVLIPEAGAVASKEETDRSKRLIKEYIKSLGHLSIPGLLQLFDTHYLQPIKTENELNGTLQQLNNFIDKLINNLWKMKMADPPLALVWQEKGEPFSRSLSTVYKKTGNQVVQPVWPTVLSRQGGPIMYKGIVIAQ